MKKKVLLMGTQGSGKTSVGFKAAMPSPPRPRITHCRRTTYPHLILSTFPPPLQMRSIIFADYLAQDTRRLQATIDVEYSSVAFLGNLQ